MLLLKLHATLGDVAPSLLTHSLAFRILLSCVLGSLLRRPSSSLTRRSLTVARRLLIRFEAR